MKARRTFWLALLFTIMLVPMVPTFVGLVDAQNANQTLAITALPNVTTQIIPTGGTFPTVPYGISVLFIGTTGAAASSQWSLYAGTVNNDSPPCATGRTVLTGALPIGFSSLVNSNFVGSLNQNLTIAGAPAIVAPGGAAVCLAYTGATGAAISGFVTFNR